MKTYADRAAMDRHGQLDAQRAADHGRCDRSTGDAELRPQPSPRMAAQRARISAAFGVGPPAREDPTQEGVERISAIAAADAAAKPAASAAADPTEAADRALKHDFQTRIAPAPTLQLNQSQQSDGQRSVRSALRVGAAVAECAAGDVMSATGSMPMSRFAACRNARPAWALGALVPYGFTRAGPLLPLCPGRRGVPIHRQNPS